MPSLVKICPVVLEKKILKICQCIFAFSLLSPIEKKGGASFDQTWIPFTLKCFLPSLIEIDPVVLEKKMKMWKVYDNNNDDDEQQTHFNQKSFGSGKLRKDHRRFSSKCLV